MNARVDFVQNDGATAAMHMALEQIIRSTLFVRAPRTSKLLSFLVEKKLEGKEHEITEHQIGLNVFRRDARSYDTSLDPVVRVQMGRLRARLVEYYAAQPSNEMLVSIPLGSYIPTFTEVARPVTYTLRRPILVTPLRNLAGAGECQTFVAGVDEELGLQLFHAFGSLVQIPQQAIVEEIGGAEVHHRLEGSIRIESHHVRASMRLIDTKRGDIAWLSQFDFNGDLGMHLQEELAGAICMQLRSYLATV